MYIQKVFACTYWNEYLVLTSVSTRTYESVYLVLTEVFTSYLLKRVRRIHFIAIEEPYKGDTPA